MKKTAKKSTLGVAHPSLLLQISPVFKEYLVAFLPFSFQVKCSVMLQSQSIAVYCPLLVGFRINLQESFLVSSKFLIAVDNIG